MNNGGKSAKRIRNESSGRKSAGSQSPLKSSDAQKKREVAQEAIEMQTLCHENYSLRTSPFGQSALSSLLYGMSATNGSALHNARIEKHLWGL
jgi:hypothetical protein